MTTRMLVRFLRVAAVRSAVSVCVLLLPVLGASAAELKMLTANGVRGAISELALTFQAATGHTLAIDYEVVDVLKQRMDGGETFDVTILRPEVLDALISAGKVLADSKTVFARTGLGVAIRKGGSKPDISTIDALKRTLLAAGSVGYAREGGSGKAVLRALATLGIAQEMKPKLKAFDGSTTVPSVVSGEVDIVLSGLGPILSEPGAELVGSLPEELQTYIVFAVGVSSNARAPDAARALVRYITAPAAIPVLQSQGLESITP